jgi:hypothetical protein
VNDRDLPLITVRSGTPRARASRLAGWPVERWFAELTNCKLRRSAHRSVAELETDIRKRVNEWNESPKPFAWTRTAGEILGTLAAYCQRIIDSGYQLEKPCDMYPQAWYLARVIMNSGLHCFAASRTRCV